MKFTKDQAKKLIKLARDAISAGLKNKEFEIPEDYKEEFNEERGIFVSLYVKDDLIGCMGFPEPGRPLSEAVVNAAQGAAFEDPRFPPLKSEQMKDLRIELSILTEPKEIKVKKASEYPDKVKIGRDGLMVRDKFGAGLLLPQVAVKWDWNSKEFLDNTCKKAGLSPDCWNNMKRNVYKFQAQVFTEKNGKIVEEKQEA